MNSQNSPDGRDKDFTTPDSNQLDREQDQDQDHDQSRGQKQEQGKGHGPLKGTDTAATTDWEYAERERGKRTTM
jgi:hypothetical protein